MLTTLLLSAVIGPVKSLSCTIEPMSTDQFLARLGRDARVQLTAKGEVGRDVLTLCVKDAPFDEVLARIAHVTYATWSHDRRGLVLERSRDAGEEAAKAQQARLKTAFMNDLRPFVKALGETYDAAHIAEVSDERAQVKANDGTESRLPLLPFDYEDPVMLAMGRLLLAVDPQQISRMHIGEKLAFSTDPDPAREVSAFRGDTSATLERLGKEQDIWSRVHLSRPGSDSADWSADREDEFLHGSTFSAHLSQSPWTRAKPFRAKPTSAILWITEVEFGHFNCDLQVSGPSEEPVVGMGWWLGPPYVPGAANKPPSDLVPLRPESVALDMPEARRMWWLDPDTGLVNKRPIGNGTHPLQAPFPTSPKLEPWISDPIRHDPLSLLFPEALEGLAKERSCNLVADLSDASMECVQRAKHGNAVSPEETLELIKGSGDMEAESEPGWISIRPTDLEEVGARRPDLRTVRAVLGRLRRTGKIRVQDYIDIAKASPTRSSRTPPLFVFLSKLTDDRIFRFQDWSLLRLLASLSSEQRNDLFSGRKIPFSELLPDALAAVTDLRVPSPWPDSSTMATREHPSKPGISAVLTVDQDIDLIDPLRPGGYYYWVTVPSPLGGFWTGPGVLTPESGLDGTLCQLHTRERLTINLDEAPDKVKVLTLFGGESSALGPPIPYAKLPEKLRRAVKTLYDWIPKSPFRAPS